MFGDVPLVLKLQKSLAETAVKRATIDEIYAAIISDLTYATDPKKGLSITPWQFGAGQRNTLGSAYALLANVYLTRKNWTKAAEAAKKVIDGGKYGLFKNYGDAFLYTYKYQGLTNVNSYSGIAAPLGEAIFSFDFNQDFNLGFRTGWLFGPPNVRSAATDGVTQNARRGAGILDASVSAQNAYKAGDLRRDWTLPAGYLDMGTSPFCPAIPGKISVAPYPSTGIRTGSTVTFDIRQYCMKYRNDGQAGSTNGSWRNQFPIIRYAEVLLTYAEAQNEADGSPNAAAYTAINLVRGRAGLAPLTGLSQIAFRDAIKAERRVEFMGEAKRVFDLIRWGDFYSTMNATGLSLADGQHLYPIPQAYLDANPLVKPQNKGWN
jgi:hypothetical protein